MSWLINSIYYIVPFIVLLGILVFVHEFGHYLIAKLCGVKVDEFSLGFGKQLWGRRDASGTLWKISAVPLGGYCKFVGDSDAASGGSETSTLSEEDKKYAFATQSPFKKLAIAVGGPGFNYLFAFLIFVGIFMTMGAMNFPPVVGEVIKGGAAEKAGILPQDRILTINGKQIKTFQNIRQEVEMAADGFVDIELMRGEQKINKKIKLEKIPLEVENNQEERPMLGVTSVPTAEFGQGRLSFVEAVKEAGVRTWRVTELTLRGVGQMISGRRSTDDLGGIVRIAEMTGDISKSNSWMDFLVFMALLSINLGLINLFPIPFLDGGHVVIYLIEIVTRREINEQVKEYIFKLGFFLLIALMVFATYNDIARLFNRWFS